MNLKKIDLVYLWVDDADSVWKEKRRKAYEILGRELPPDSTSLIRIRDNDELKYSLRSLEKFAPWINHIFIITDGHRPKWLADHPLPRLRAASNQRVTIVDHTKFIPKEYLPTFNSNAMELFLHKIPGLSEHFLFANDDCIFGAPVTPDFFFDDNGNPIVIMKEYLNTDAVFGDDAAYSKYTDQRGIMKIKAKNAARFTYKKTGRKYHTYLAHAVEPMRKSFLLSLMTEHGKEFIKTSATQFREKSNIQRTAFPMMANAAGQNTIVLNWRFGERRIKYRRRKNE